MPRGRIYAKIPYAGTVVSCHTVSFCLRFRYPVSGAVRLRRTARGGTAVCGYSLICTVPPPNRRGKPSLPDAGDVPHTRCGYTAPERRRTRVVMYFRYFLR